jgi:hypothetical protein
MSYADFFPMNKLLYSHWQGLDAKHNCQNNNILSMYDKRD